MSMAIIGGVVAAGVAVYGVASSESQKNKANKRLDALNKNQPIETIPDEIIQNQELAKLRAKTGIPAEQYAMAQKAIARQQAKSQRRAGELGKGLDMLAVIDDNSKRAQGNLDAKNADTRLRNEGVLMDVNNQVGNWKKGIYDRNIRQPWERDYDYNMGVKGSANQNKANSINSLANLALTYTSGYGRGGAYGGNGNGMFTNRRRNGGYGTGVGGDPNGGNLRLDEYGNLIN